MNTISIIIPTLNEEQFLPDLFKSLIRQDIDIRTIPIILADAGSSDLTIDVALQFKKKFNLNLSIISGGLPAAGRNAGAKIASTKYILFLDADIKLKTNDLLSKSLKLITEKNLDLVTTNIECPHDNFLYMCNNFCQQLSRLARPFATGMFMLMNATTFQSLGGFDEDILFAEDYLLSRKIQRKKFGIVSGHVTTTNRRFKKISKFQMIKKFLGAAIHFNDAWFRQNHNWW